jgi:hypothetical protein
LTIQPLKLFVNPCIVIFIKSSCKTGAGAKEDTEMKKIVIRTIEALVKCLGYEEIINYSKINNVTEGMACYLLAKAKSVECKKGLLEEIAGIKVLSAEDRGAQSADSPSDARESPRTGGNGESGEESSEEPKKAIESPVEDKLENPKLGEVVAIEKADVSEGVLEGQLKDYKGEIMNKTKEMADTISGKRVVVDKTSRKGNCRYNNREYRKARIRDEEMRKTKPCTYFVTLTNLNQPEGVDHNPINEEFYRLVGHGLSSMYRKRGLSTMTMWEGHLSAYLHCHFILYAEEWIDPAEASLKEGDPVGDRTKKYLEARFAAFAHVEATVSTSEESLNYVLKTYKCGAEKIMRQLDKEGKPFEDWQKECIIGEMVTSALHIKQLQCHGMPSARKRSVQPAPVAPVSDSGSVQKSLSDEEILDLYEQGKISDEEFLAVGIRLFEKYVPCATHCFEVVKRTDCPLNKEQGGEESGTIAYMMEKAGIQTCGNKCKGCPLMDLYSCAIDRAESA